MRAEEELRQGLVNLVGRVAMGLATDHPLEGLADVVVEAGPELKRLKGDLVLAKLEESMKPRKVRKTQGWIRRNGRALVEAAGSGR